MNRTLFLLLTGCVVELAGAQSTAPLSAVSVEDLISKLAPPPASARRTRNLVPQKRQIDLVINFDYGSARLQPVSLPLLESLAEAMKDERLRAVRFKVEGHTDGRGSARYNEDLSARRAQSVATFLETQGVATGRLDTQGRGFSELLIPDRPAAPENRRVRIVALD